MVFSVPTFSTVGDPYDKKKVIDERSHGKSFITSAPKIGHGPDACFQKTFLSIHEGDKFVDPGTNERRYRLEKKKKNITDTGFKFANPPQKGEGLGSYYGCSGTVWPHETDYIVPRKGEAPPRRQIAPRPIFTNPPKKGGFGFPGTSITPVGTDYIADFYEAKRERDRKALLEHYSKMKGAPFKAACRLGGTFDEQGGTGVSECYKMTKPMAILNRPAKAAPKKIETAWRPAGQLPELWKLEYREDPWDGFDPRVGKQKKVKKDDSVFRPAGATNTSWYTSSIAFKRL